MFKHFSLSHNPSNNSIDNFYQHPSNVLNNFISDGMRVAEIGYTNGFFTNLMAKKVGNSGMVYAIDIDASRSKYNTSGKNSNPIKNIFCIQSKAKESFKIIGKLDFILFFYSLDKISNREFLFQNINRILKVGGILLIIEPIFESNISNFKDYINLSNKSGFKYLIKSDCTFNHKLLFIK